MADSSCSPSCLLSIVFVAILWGATNPFLRRGARASTAPLHQDVHPLLRPLLDLFSLLRDWRFFLPLALNQGASILFMAVVSSFPISLVVPLANSLQLVVTAVVGWMLGERLSARAVAGCVLISGGVCCMLADDQLRS